LPAEPYLDLVFIDADKPGYATYWAELVPRTRPGGVLLVDNVLWSGRVLDPRTDSDRAIVDFNDMVLADRPRRGRHAAHRRRPHDGAPAVGQAGGRSGRR
jgi:predicted O-methyltransferase YrrM